MPIPPSPPPHSGTPSSVPSELRALLDAISDPCVAVDTAQRILHCNAAFAALAGGGSSGQAVAACHDLLKLDACESGCASRRAMDGGQPVTITGARSAASGAELTVVATPLRRDDGTIWGAVEVYRPTGTAQTTAGGGAGTTHIAHVERELRQARAQLLVSEKMSSLGQLINGIAHEINNPINFIYSNLDFLEDHVLALLTVVDAVMMTPLPPADREALEQGMAAANLDFIRGDLPKLLTSIREGAERVASIVQALRTVSQGSQESLKPYNLNDGVNTVLRNTERTTAGVCTVVKELGELPPVLCNSAQLNQVVANLLSNAIDAVRARAPHGRITLRTRAQDAAIVLEVEDDGCGIPADVQDKIYDPFFTTKDVGKGVGLGLAISMGIVRAHGGSITMTSAEGRGSTFRVTLPTQPG